MSNPKRFTLVCGHYGCGKTNLSINLAVDRAKSGRKVILVDLDLVNPYFRSSDYTDVLQQHGIHVISPNYAGSTLDVPSIPAEIDAVFDTESDVILDVGGDDAGATVLGRLSKRIQQQDYEMLYVINCYRSLTTTAQEAARLLPEIEAASHLKATSVVNNSHLQNLTTAKDIANSIPFATKTAELLHLPLCCTTVPKQLAGEFLDFPDKIYPVTIYVRPPWEDAVEKGGI